MPRTFEGKLDATGRSFALVVSRFNNFITERLLEGALDCLVRHGAAEDALSVYRVPGSFEIPLVAQHVARLDQHDGIICLGALIRGSTPHFDYIAAEVTKGIAQVSLASGTPITYGVLTCDTIEQAVERAGTKMGNKGWEAAMSAMETVDLLARSSRETTENGS